jgi:hypothetical protein
MVARVDPLHARLIEAIAAAGVATWRPRPATTTALAAAEARLGGPLPAGYRAFALALGAIDWPVVILGPAALARADDGRPAYLIPFAHDPSGNDWSFDTRERSGDELAIVYWDLEDPPPDDELAGGYQATPFAEWLAERLDDAGDGDG